MDLDRDVVAKLDLAIQLSSKAEATMTDVLQTSQISTAMSLPRDKIPAGKYFYRDITVTYKGEKTESEKLRNTLCAR